MELSSVGLETTSNLHKPDKSSSKLNSFDVEEPKFDDFIRDDTSIGMRCVDIITVTEDGEKEKTTPNNKKKTTKTTLKGLAGGNAKFSSIEGSIHEYRDGSRVKVTYNTFDDFYKVGYLERYPPLRQVPLYGRVVNMPEIEWGEATCIKWDYCVQSPMLSKNFIRLPIYGHRDTHKREKIEEDRAKNLKVEKLKADETYKLDDKEDKSRLFTPLESVDTLVYGDVVYLSDVQMDKTARLLAYSVVMQKFSRDGKDNDSKIKNNAGWLSGYKLSSRNEIKPAPNFKCNFNVDNVDPDRVEDSHGSYNLTYQWIDGSEFEVTFPPGKYDLALMNRVLHNHMDSKGHYFVRKSDRRRVYLMELEANRSGDQDENHDHIDESNQNRQYDPSRGKYGYVYLRLRALKDVIEDEYELSSREDAREDRSLSWLQSVNKQDAVANIDNCVQCIHMSEPLRKTLGFPTAMDSFPTIEGSGDSLKFNNKNKNKKYGDHTVPTEFDCYLSSLRKSVDLHRYVKDVLSAESGQKFMDITFRSEIKSDDEPGQKWFNKTNARLQELPQMKSLAETLNSNFHGDDTALQDKHSLYKQVTKVRYDVLKSSIFTQKRWSLIRFITSDKAGTKRCKDGDAFKVNNADESEITIKGDHKDALVNGGKGRDEQLYLILKFISSSKAVIFNDVVSMALIAIYSFEINRTGATYATLRTLLGICLIFLWIPHLLSMCLTHNFYGHSKGELKRSLHFIVWLYVKLRNMTRQDAMTEEDIDLEHCPSFIRWLLSTKDDIDMEHTLPFILPQKRAKRGVMGCYHLCNAILLYNFAINMIYKHGAMATERVKHQTSRGQRLVSRDMLSRVLLRAEPQLFSRFMKWAMYFTMASVPVTVGLNLYQYSFEDDHLSSINIALYVIWIWCSPYTVACASHAIALFCFTLHAHTLDMEMFIERLDADRLGMSSKRVTESDWQWFRDKAFLEEYLFHQLLVQKSSAVWELSLSTSLICSMSLFILGAATVGRLNEAFAADDVASVNSLVFMILGLVGFISVFHSVAMLNGRLKKPILAVKEASSSDWNQLADKNIGDDAGSQKSSVGGRERLLDYFQSNPIAFKIYGIEITFQAYVLVGSSMFSIFLIMISIYLGNRHNSSK